MNTQELTMFTTTAKPDSVGVISAKPLCDFFGLDWSNQQRLIKNDSILPQLMSKKPSTGADGKTYQMVYFTKKAFARWVQLINYKTVKPELQEKFLMYQSNIFDYLYGSIEVKDQSAAHYARLKKLKTLHTKIGTEIKRTEKLIQQYVEQHLGIQTELQLLEN